MARIQHEELEHTVLAGLNFRGAYINLRAKIRVTYEKLLSQPESNEAFRIALFEIVTQANDVHLTFNEDSVLLLTKQRHYQSARKGNLRRRAYHKRKRIQAHLDAEPVPSSSSFPTFLSPEQAAQASDIPPDLSNLQYNPPDEEQVPPIETSTKLTDEENERLWNQIREAEESLKQRANTRFDGQTRNKPLQDGENNG